MNIQRLPRICTGYQEEMAKFKVQVSRWFLIFAALAIIVAAVWWVAMPLSKRAWDHALNRPEAWFRYLGPDYKEFVGIKIDGRKIPAEKLTNKQKEKIQQGQYEFGGWVGPNERWGN
jgi:hypothetical protein